MAGLFNRVRNTLTGRRFLISTIKKDAKTFETAVFRANFFYLPQGLRLTNPCLVRQTSNPQEADALHRELSVRLVSEYPERVFQDYGS
jgi:tRNA nucleotidyltransferase/poly(A) polymerase